MAEIITIPYKPRYPGVHEALDSHRFVVLVAHRRFGKTVLAVNHLIKQAATCTRERGSFAYVAPFRNQAKEIAWGYLKHYTAVIPGRTVNEGDLSLMLPNGARIRVFGADNPDALRGLYFDGVVLDEVAQMKPEVWSEIIQPALADRKGWTLFIGTPKGVNLFSELYGYAREAMNEGSDRYDPAWAALCYRVDETEALPADEVERLRRELSESAWRQEMLCDFSASADDTLIPIDLVTEACARRVDYSDVDGMPMILGVDVARFGSDASVICKRRGLVAFPPIVFRGLDNMELADRVAAEIAESHPDAVFIDAGQGQGVIDRLRHMGHKIVEIPFGGKALHAARFANRRSEMWYGLREWLKGGGYLAVEGQNGIRLKSELSTPLYWYDAAGKIVLEPKDKIKERLGASPDIADALALTFAAPVSLASVAGRHRRTAMTDYNVLEWR
jgi:hypothetical protein